MPGENPLVDLGGLSKPADTLVKKIAGAIGVLYEPKRIVRRARAEAEAEKIATLAEIESDALRKRALERFIAEEERKQSNIEAVIEKAIPQVQYDAAAEDLEEDWLAYFFDRMKFVSDETIQDMWARVLAGETNKPQSYSKRSVDVLASLDKQDAVAFQNLCRFVFAMGNFVVIVYDSQNLDSIYNDYGINFGTLTHLDSLGLIRYDPLSGFARMRLPKRITVVYYGKNFILEFTKEADNQFPIGHVFLTQSGQEIAPISESEASNHILEYTIQAWIEKGIRVSSPVGVPQEDF